MSQICPECGATTPDGSSNCEACGYKFRPRFDAARPNRSSRRDDIRDDDPRDEETEDRPRRKRREYDDEYDENFRGGVPHRGTTVLVMGILGFVCCAFFAPAAWIMGSTDLRKMREGTMDDTGRGTTQAGMILGIVGSVLLILTCGVYGIAIAVGGVH